MSDDILKKYEDANAVFMAGKIEDETSERLLVHLAGLSNQPVVNEATKSRDVIRGLTINNILLKRHIDGLQAHITTLNRQNSWTQGAVIVLTVASLLGAGLQSWYAYRADARAAQETAKFVPPASVKP